MSRHKPAGDSQLRVGGDPGRSTEIRSIKTKLDYRAALKEIEALMTAERNSPEGERLDVLAALVEAYEKRHDPLDLFFESADPEEIKTRIHGDVFVTRVEVAIK